MTLVRSGNPFSNTRARTIDRVVQVDVRHLLLRTLLLGSLFAVLLGLPFVVHYRAEYRAAKALHEADMDRVVQLAATVIRLDLAAVLLDMRYLSTHNELHRFLAFGTPGTRRALAVEYQALAEQKQIYERLSFVSPKGIEQVRVDLRDGIARIVPREELGRAPNLAEYGNISKLLPYQIYVSPFHLHRRDAEPDAVRKPAIHFAIPVANDLGEILGIVTLSYLGQHLLDRLLQIGGGPGNLWLLDKEGRWLLGAAGVDRDAGAAPERLDEINTALWRSISDQASGVYSGARTWVRFERVFPFIGQGAGPRLRMPVNAEQYYWTVASVFSAAAIKAADKARLTRLGDIYWVVLVFAFGLAGLLAFVSGRSRALANSMERVIDNLPVMIAYVDAGERYRFNNQAHEEFFGVNPKQIFGRSVGELFGKEAYTVLQPHVRRALSGETANFEHRLAFPRAGVKDVTASFIPDTAQNGHAQGFFCVISDVSGLKEAERKARHHLGEVAHIARLASIGEMASQIAHEINQPLAAISLYSATCLRAVGQGGGHADLPGWLEAINVQAKRASEVVRRIRQFVRKGEMQSQALDLNKVVLRVVDLLRQEADSLGVEVELDLAAALPEVEGDQVLLEQVLFNLLRNALDVLQSWQGTRKVRIRSEVAADQVQVEVSDSGPGVDPAIAETVFDSFVSTKSNGLGLGLAISRSIIEAHSGKLRFSNDAAGGATFSFSLNRKPAA